MHHLSIRRQLPRLFVFVFATVLCAAMLHWPQGDQGLHEAVSDPVRDRPHAAATPVPSSTPAPLVAGTVLVPHRVPTVRTIDGKNLKGRQPARPAARPQARPRPHASRSAARPPARTPARRARPVRAHVPGQDISWPQCGSQPMPYADIEFLIIGLTNGPSFTRNPCIAQHLAWARRHHTWTAAYAFATFPRDGQIARLGRTGPYDGRHWLGRVQNAAWQTALFNVRTMRQHGFTTPHVWLDVEQSSSRPWTHNKQWNRAVLAAWIRGYRSFGYSVGIYSSRNIWHQIMGNHRLRLPEWRTAGPASARAALGRCRESSFQGGHGILAQWWDDRRDYDRMCPGFKNDRAMRQFFAKY